MEYEDALATVRVELERLGDPERAIAMAAYMKSDMPCLGVASPDRIPILRRLVAYIPATDRQTYEGVVRSLWRREYREEKYLAIRYARSFPAFIDTESIPLYRTLIVEGAWWDFVDESAVRLVGGALSNDHLMVEPVVRSWIRDADRWLRRTSIICQLAARADTDLSLLADACVANVQDSDFFIRKAIGWALREYAKTDPDWVRCFVAAHREVLSGLSVREATKHL
jgi:3-methyladenine DNA glycosylase AlkD